MDKLRRIVEEQDTKGGRIFDVTTQILIVFSLIGFSLETLPSLEPWIRDWLRFSEIAIVLAFTLEYSLRVLVATRKARFIFSFFGLVDLLAVLPFFLSTGIDLRAVRAFRLLRLVRIFKLVRYSHSVQRFHIALRLAKEDLILFFCVSAVVVFLASVGIYYCERESQPDKFASVFHCLWWSIVTLTTVGYGDTYPVTPQGRLFTGLVLVAGIAIVAVPAGLLSSALGRARELQEEQMRREEHLT